jgi:hypothetical protein
LPVRTKKNKILLAGKVLEWEAMTNLCTVGNPSLRAISETARELPFCALPVTRNPLPHAAIDALFT